MLIPATRYSDCEVALTFLRDVVGLREHAVFRDESGNIVHAQIALGNGIMMFGPDAAQGDFGQYMIPPDETAGRATVTIYAVIQDVAACHARVHATDAEILIPVTEQDHGGVSFSFRDPGGHIWTMGDYDPTDA